MTGAPRVGRRHALLWPVLGYLAVAIVLTWPLAARLTSVLGAPEGVGDPYLNLWSLGWGLHAWTTDPGGVLAGGVFDANIFHPAAGTLTYSDHLLLQSFVLAPVYALSGNPVLCYNLLLILSIAASGLAAHALVRGVTGSEAGAWAAGLAWAAWPYRTAHFLHLQLQALYFLPLALLFLHRVVASRRRRDAAGTGILAALQALASVYYGVMTMVTLAVGAVALALTTGQWRSSRLWRRLVLAAAVGGLLVAPVAIVYLRAGAEGGFGRTLYEASNHAATLQSYTQVPPSNLAYGATGLLAPRAPAPGERDRRSVEHQMFPGFVVVLLAVVGLWRGWRSDHRPAVVTAAALAVTGGVLSLGPDGVRWLYAALYDHVFGFQAVRAPARFSVVAMLGGVVLAGYGLRDLTARWPRRAAAVTLAVLALMATEYVNRPLAYVPAPPLQTEVGQWLASAPGPGAVVVLPLGSDTDNTPAMVQSLEHWRPLVNGYSGQRPPFFSAVVESLAVFPAPEALVTLRELGVRFVVTPDPVATGPASPLVERARFDDGTIYELVWTPDAEAALRDVTTAPPPPPGPAPFDVGEVAEYEIRWDGGPVDLPAGTATLRVLAGGQAPAGAAGAHWTFEALAGTADWVTTFFEARDRFVTAVDGQMLPLVHVREIREGKRRLDRAYVYDRQAGVVRSAETVDGAREGTGVALPLTAAARDALGVFYYVRSLPLEAGDVVRAPLNEAGRALELELTVGGVEDVPGHPGLRGRRLAPRIGARIERRAPPAITLWLSDDDRRIPLAAVVEAGFGRVRADLVDYRR
ncbi:MAG: DUF3108 domain-containing protein [Vicinamibacterales bacterium]